MIQFHVICLYTSPPLIAIADFLDHSDNYTIRQLSDVSRVCMKRGHDNILIMCMYEPTG